MKKILMATTAVAAVALASGDAYAQASAAGPIRLGLGGYFQFYGVYGTQSDGVGEPGANRHNFDFKREAEIFFTGQTKLDNGLIVGVDVQLEAESCIDQIDESYIWFQGNWGRLILGSENSAPYLLAVGAPTVDSNFDGQDPNYRLFNGVVGDPRGIGSDLRSAALPLGSLGNGSGTSSIDAYVPLISGDSEKLTYLSPRIAGFRGGFSYTPDNSEDGNVPGSGQISTKGGSFVGMPMNNNIAQYSNVVSGGVNYEGKFGPVDILAGAGYEIGFLESGSTAIAGNLKDSRQSWQAGVDLGFAGFHFGGGYYYDDNGFEISGTQRSWALGLTYTIGPLTVGASYLDAERNRATVAGVVLPDEELKRYMIGARYALGPGVDLRASGQYYNYDAGTNGLAGQANNDAWFGVIGTVLTF
jgi:outer membrane protein OmpU